MADAAAKPKESSARIDDLTLTQLYDEHARVLLAYATRLSGGDVHRAEDSVQEALLRAWKHPEAFREGAGSPRAWLMRVVHNVVVDEIRARRSRPREMAGAEVESVADTRDDVEAALQSWTVAEALSQLTSDHRAVLVETYYRGRSVTEAATTLGIPAGTVKSRTFYALRALRLALSERGMVT